MSPGTSRKTFDCRPPVEASSRWRNARSVEARRDLRAHEFEEHQNAPSVVEMHESTKVCGKWARQNASLLANLKVGIEPSRSRAFGCRHQSLDNALRHGG